MQRAEIFAKSFIFFMKETPAFPISMWKRERTEKFHVSSLLAKFRVRGRMELVREAGRLTAVPMTVAEPVGPRETRPSLPAPHRYTQVARNVGPIGLAKQQMLA